MTTLNADPAELEKFGDLAHRWWDREGEFRPLHEINPLRLEWIAARVPLDGLRAIDVGCGGGILAEAMAARGAGVTGIDLSEKPLRVAQLHLHESGHAIDYRLESAEAVAAREGGVYDLVTCMEMLEHVPDPASAVAACASLARPGGAVFFSTINRNPRAYLFAVIGAEYLLGLLPKGTHDYERFMRPAELSRWARDGGLELQELRGLAYNPVTKRYRLTADCGVNYMAYFRRPA